MAHKDQLDLKARSAHKDQKEMPVPLALMGLPVRLDPQAQLACKDRKETSAQPELLARAEDLTANRSFRAAAFSSCQLESRG